MRFEIEWQQVLRYTAIKHAHVFSNLGLRHAQMLRDSFGPVDHDHQQTSIFSIICEFVRALVGAFVVASASPLVRCPPYVNMLQSSCPALAVGISRALKLPTDGTQHVWNRGLMTECRAASQKCQRHPPSMTPVAPIGRGTPYQKRLARKITKTEECTCMGG